MSVLDLHQPAQRDALEVLLRLLVHEVAADHCPALGDLGEGSWARGGEAEVVGCAHGEVGHELDVAHGVGAELEGRGGDAVFGLSAEGFEVGCGDVARWADRVEEFGVGAGLGGGRHFCGFARLAF